MKKLLAGLLTTAVVVTSAVGLAACNKPGGGPSIVNHASSSQDLLGMAMASAGTYAPVDGIASAAADKTAEELIVDEIESRIQLITDYVKTENKPSTVIEDFVPTEGDEILAGLDKKMLFNKKDIYGNDETYTFYYKEVKEVNGKDENVDEGEEADLETEEEFKLTGKLAIGDKFYDMVGERSVETETEEEDGETSTETESEFEAIVTFDDNSQMIFKQEIEVEGNEREESFKYTIIDATGKKVQEFSIEIENEQGENEIEYLDTANNIAIELEQEFKKGSNELELKYTESGVITRAKVIIKEDGTRTYKINNQTIVVAPKTPAPEVEQNVEA